MRRLALASLLALLACRERARREEEPLDAGAVSPDAARVADAGRTDTNDLNPQGRRAFRVTARDGWRVRAGDRLAPAVTAFGGEVVALVGRNGEDDAREAEVIEEGGEGARFVLRDDRAAIELPRTSGVAGVILRGDVRIRLPRMASAPLRFDTAQGRVIVAEGEASIRVGVAQGVAWTEVSARGAAVTVWAPRGDGAAVPEVLAARGVRRWRTAFEDPCERAARAVDAAAVALAGDDGGVSDLGLARASMALGGASAWVAYALGAGPPLRGCAAGLRGRRDALSARLAELAR